MAQNEKHLCFKSEQECSWHSDFPSKFYIRTLTGNVMSSGFELKHVLNKAI